MFMLLSLSLLTLHFRDRFWLTILFLIFFFVFFFFLYTLTTMIRSSTVSSLEIFDQMDSVGKNVNDCEVSMINLINYQMKHVCKHPHIDVDKIGIALEKKWKNKKKKKKIERRMEKKNVPHGDMAIILSMK